VQGVVIATPVASHYPLAKQALLAGKHVFVEKPIAETAAQAQELTDLAKAKGLTLMIDHTFLFHPVVRRLKDLMDKDAFGKISYIDSLRVNLGLFQPDVNVLWDLAPHDLSIVDYLLDEEPSHIEATGYCHVNGQLPDIAYVTLHYGSRKVVHLNLSWMSPVKARRVAIGGSKKMAVWDDLDRDEPLRIYDSGITVMDQSTRETVMPGYRIGDVYAPRMSGREALQGVADHFAAVIAGVETSVMDGGKGVRMLKILEAAQQKLDISLGVVNAHYAHTEMRAIGKGG
jgi:predicted dehydrogenase